VKRISHKLEIRSTKFSTGHLAVETNPNDKNSPDYSILRQAKFRKICEKFGMWVFGLKMGVEIKKNVKIP